MKILISNDDGIYAPGIAKLEEAMRELGDVVVVAPNSEQSGAAHSLTLHRPLRITQHSENRYSVDGTPTDCVYLAMLEIFKDDHPDLIVSGINHGANLGNDITYSGTVSAALEGVLLGIPSIAFSLVHQRDEVLNFDQAQRAVKKVVKMLEEYPLPKHTLYNVNIPNVQHNNELAVEFTYQGNKQYESATVEKIDPRGKKYYWIGGNILEFDQDPGSDSNAIREGRVSISPIRIDMTNHQFLKTLQESHAKAD